MVRCESTAQGGSSRHGDVRAIDSAAVQQREVTMQREFNPNDLQKALLGYEASDLETGLIEWAREHWPMAARGMIYAKREADDTVSGVQGIRDDQTMLGLQIAVRAAISERDLTMRTIAAILPAWLEKTYGLTPKV